MSLTDPELFIDLLLLVLDVLDEVPDPVLYEELLFPLSSPVCSSVIMELDSLLFSFSLSF